MIRQYGNRPAPCSEAAHAPRFQPPNRHSSCPAASPRPDAGPQRGRSPDGAVVTSKRHAVLSSRKKSDIPIVVEVRGLIVAARKTVAAAVNASLTTLYWQIGTRIRRDDPAREAGRLRRGDCADTVCTIERRVRTGVFQAQPGIDGPVRRAFPRRKDSPDTVWKIGLEPLHRAPPARQAPPARLLRRDVPPRTLERAYLAPADRRHALRAHRALQEARQADREGADRAPDGRQADARSRLQGSRTSSIFSVCATPTRRKIWRPRSCATSSASSWSWAPASRSSSGRSES